MRTLITKQIDGYTIVLGVDRPVVDAVSTMERIDQEIIGDPLIQEIAKKCTQAQLIAKKWNKSRKRKRQAAMTQTLEEQYNKSCVEISELKAHVDEKRFAMLQADPIYFEPKQGETLVSDEVGEDHLSKLPIPHGKKLVMYGGYVTDIRGQKYWIKIDGRWEQREIGKLGQEIPDGGVTVDEMTTETRIDIGEQLKDDYIRGLEGEEFEAEKNKTLAIALDQAAFMKSKLEIQGDPDPLGNSKVWYESELKRIEEKFDELR